MLHKSDLEDDIAAYIKDRVPAAPMDVMFDVGANWGWVIRQFLSSFPSARVWAFEPVTSTFSSLKWNLARFQEINPFPRTTLVQTALGDEVGVGKVTMHPNLTVNRIVEGESQEPTEAIVIDTGDNYVRSHSIERINFLKIDAEGYDLKVLHGFAEMVSNGRIDFIQVEASLSDSNADHIPLREFSDYLKPFGYELFRFNNQASYELPILTSADVIFIQRDVAASFLGRLSDVNG
jgi:FkbM family methyltransferase